MQITCISANEECHQINFLIFPVVVHTNWYGNNEEMIFCFGILNLSNPVKIKCQIAIPILDCQLSR